MRHGSIAHGHLSEVVEAARLLLELPLIFLTLLQLVQSLMLPLLVELALIRLSLSLLLQHPLLLRPGKLLSLQGNEVLVSSPLLLRVLSDERVHEQRVLKPLNVDQILRHRVQRWRHRRRHYTAER